MGKYKDAFDAVPPGTKVTFSVIFYDSMDEPTSTTEVTKVNVSDTKIKDLDIPATAKRFYFNREEDNRDSQGYGTSSIGRVGGAYVIVDKVPATAEVEKIEEFLKSREYSEVTFIDRNKKVLLNHRLKKKVKAAKKVKRPLQDSFRGLFYVDPNKALEKIAKLEIENQRLRKENAALQRQKFLSSKMKRPGRN